MDKSDNLGGRNNHHSLSRKPKKVSGSSRKLAKSMVCVSHASCGSGKRCYQHPYQLLQQHFSSVKLGGDGSKCSKIMGSGSHAPGGSDKSSKSDGNHHNGYHIFSHKVDKSDSIKGSKRAIRYSGYG